MSLKNLLLGPGSAYTAYDGKTPKINPLATKQSTMHAVNNTAGYSISGDYAAITNNDYQQYLDGAVNFLPSPSKLDAADGQTPTSALRDANVGSINDSFKKGQYFLNLPG
jgi:hypothetical protein